MNEVHKVPAQAVLSRVLTARSGQVVPDGGKHILLASMPKSASTYLCAIISEMPGVKEVLLTIGHDRREQELCPLECAVFHEFNYVASHHVRYSKATRDILTLYSIFPVILVRNIYDCVVSLRDHLNRESLVIPQAYVPSNFRDLTTEQQYDFIIDFVVPWYANFFGSWSEYDGPQIAIAYRELIQDFPAAVTEILRAVGLKASRNDIELAISKVNPTAKRFNVGQVGRGIEKLSAEQIDRIREKFSFYKDVAGVGDILGYEDSKTFTGRVRWGIAPAGTRGLVASR